jgi:DNA-binding GntR family transcriptional regulator
MVSVLRERLSDHVYQHLITQLAAGRWPIGTHLNAQSIADELSISRTTVLKAIVRLIDEGWARPGANRKPLVVGLPSSPEVGEPAPFSFANQTDRVHELILERILRGDYPPGVPVKERRLAQELGINPATVRRAAEWLCNEGLLERLPRRGWKVVTVQARDLKDIYHIRLMLEPLAIPEAIQRISNDELDALAEETDRLMAAGEKASVYERRQADHRFHRKIYDASGSRILAEALEPLIHKALLMTTVSFRYGRAARSFKEHKAILTALRARDVEESVKRLRAHLRSAQKFNVGIWERVPAPPG